MRYELIIYWGKPDESFIVEVPELSGCMADGATYEEAFTNARRWRLRRPAIAMPDLILRWWHG